MSLSDLADLPVEDYLHFMDDSLRAEHTAGQVDVLIAWLALRPGMRVLDLGCGHGRHTLELARRGYEVLGVDVVPGFLELARRRAGDEALRARFERVDMADFTADAPYDAAICLFDAFGYGDQDHHVRSLARIRSALTPGGGLLLDLRNRDFMVRLAPFAVLDKPNGDMMIDRHHFDLVTGRFTDRRTYLRGGARRDVTFSIQLFTIGELRALLASAGFEVEQVLGGWDGAPPALTRDRMLAVCRPGTRSRSAEGATIR